MTSPTSRPEARAAHIQTTADLATAFRAVTGRDLDDFPERAWDEASEAQMDLAASLADEYGRVDRRAWAARVRRWTR